MECPNCGGQLGLEDAVCPYCNTPNAFAAKHQSDMAHFRREYQRTQADVEKRTSLMQRHGSWLVILVVLLVALVGGVILQVYAWDIAYTMRERSVMDAAAEDRQAMDAYLAQGDYGQFLGYYDANDIFLDNDNPYQAVHRAAYAYVDLVESVAAIKDPDSYRFQSKYISSSCEYLAEDLIRVYTADDYASYDIDRYLPADKRVYVDDIRARTAAIAKTYFGMTDEQVADIPNMSKKKLAKVIEEGISR